MSTTKVQGDMIDVDAATVAVVAAGDKFNFLDITDSLVKEDTIQGVLDLATAGYTEITPLAHSSSTSPLSFAIPSGAEEIIMTGHGMSWAAAEKPIIDIGDSGGIETSGWLATVMGVEDEAVVTTLRVTTYFPLSALNSFPAVSNMNFTAVFRLEDASAFLWSGTSTFSDNIADTFSVAHGVKALSGEMTQIQLQSTGAFQFDAGTLYCKTK
jgi:hypothetical protein